MAISNLRTEHLQFLPQNEKCLECNADTVSLCEATVVLCGYTHTLCNLEILILVFAAASIFHAYFGFLTFTA